MKVINNFVTFLYTLIFVSQRVQVGQNSSNIDINLPIQFIFYFVGIEDSGGHNLTYREAIFRSVA